MLRFVVLTHDHPFPHWDFMLEHAGVLRTWRLDAEPWSKDPIQATPLADHRHHYLGYEGPVSGGRGEVRRWDQGIYEEVSNADSPSMVVRLAGQKLNGIVTLRPAVDELLFVYIPH